MNRLEYMTELASLLQDISEEDRRDAMEYYNAYFDEAGSENEQDVIKELGTPVRLAEQIKGGTDTTGENGGGEGGHTSYQYGQPQNTQSFSGQQSPFDTRKGEDRTWRTVLIVVIALITSPITVPLVLSVLGTILGLILAVAGTLIGLSIGAMALVIVGVMLFGVGVAALFSDFPVGLALAGVGLILTVVGAVMAVGMVAFFIHVVPVMIRGISALWNKIFHRGKAVA